MFYQFYWKFAAKRAKRLKTLSKWLIYSHFSMSSFKNHREWGVVIQIVTSRQVDQCCWGQHYLNFFSVPILIDRTSTSFLTPHLVIRPLLNGTYQHTKPQYPLHGTCGENLPRQGGQCHDFGDCILSAIPNALEESEDFSMALEQEPGTNSRRTKKMLTCAEGYMPTHKGHSNTTGNVIATPY